MCIQEISHQELFIEIIIIIILLFIILFFLKTARTSVQGKDDVLIPRVNVWLVGLVTAVSWVSEC